MEDRTPTPAHLSPSDATLDAVPPQGTGGRSSGALSSKQGYWRRVPVVEGSGPELARETQQLVRKRLRLAAVILFVGFGAFLVMHILGVDVAAPAGVLLLAFHVMTTIALGAFAAMLCYP